MSRWKLFQPLELDAAIFFADDGGIAVHMGLGTGDQYANAPRCFHGRPFAHLFAKTREELIAAAKSVGCKPAWIQQDHPPRRRSDRTHFDLTGATLDRAIAKCEAARVA